MSGAAPAARTHVPPHLYKQPFIFRGGHLTVPPCLFFIARYAISVRLFTAAGASAARAPAVKVLSAEARAQPHLKGGKILSLFPLGPADTSPKAHGTGDAQGWIYPALAKWENSAPRPGKARGAAGRSCRSRRKVLGARGFALGSPILGDASSAGTGGKPSDSWRGLLLPHEPQLLRTPTPRGRRAPSPRVRAGILLPDRGAELVSQPGANPASQSHGLV